MSKDLKEVREGAMRITGKEPSRNGNSQCKGPEAEACLGARGLVSGDLAHST